MLTITKKLFIFEFCFFEDFNTPYYLYGGFMKLLQLFLKKISGINFLAAALLLAGSMSYAQELPDKPQSFYKDLQSLNVNNFGPVVKDTKKSDRPMADIIVSKTEFVIFDSLANLFSYYSDDQQPYVYYPALNKLMTIKRGHQYGDERMKTTALIICL